MDHCCLFEAPAILTLEPPATVAQGESKQQLMNIFEKQQQLPFYTTLFRSKNCSTWTL